MDEITNQRIEKAKAEARRLKAKVTEYRARLHEQERQVKTLEDMEIVARYRNEYLNEDTNATPRPESGNRRLAASASAQKEENENDSI
jgi:hypothetical protein